MRCPDATVAELSLKLTLEVPGSLYRCSNCTSLSESAVAMMRRRRAQWRVKAARSSGNPVTRAGFALRDRAQKEYRSAPKELWHRELLCPRWGRPRSSTSRGSPLRSSPKVADRVQQRVQTVGAANRATSRSATPTRRSRGCRPLSGSSRRAFRYACVSPLFGELVANLRMPYVWLRRETAGALSKLLVHPRHHAEAPGSAP